jgi:hypothetical protein
MFLGNHAVFGEQDKLAMTGLALMVLFTVVYMAIFLKLARATSWARVSHGHGVLLTSPALVTVSSQQ